MDRRTRFETDSTRRDLARDPQWGAHCHQLLANREDGSDSVGSLRCGFSRSVTRGPPVVRVVGRSVRCCSQCGVRSGFTSGARGGLGKPRYESGGSGAIFRRDSVACGDPLEHLARVARSTLHGGWSHQRRVRDLLLHAVRERGTVLHAQNN